MSTLTLRPNAAGDETEITYQAPNSTYHWDKVDEAVADEALTNIGILATSYKRDLFGLPDSGLTVGTISQVKVLARCSKDYADSVCYMKPVLKTGSTVAEGTEQALTVGFADYSKTWLLNPETGLAWTWAEIDALQIGVALKNGAANWTQCTQVYAEVTFAEDACRVDMLSTVGSKANLVFTLDKKVKLEVLLESGG